MVQSRGFIGRRAAPKTALPPGQYLTEDFPVPTLRLYGIEAELAREAVAGGSA
jgi:hypothetical protein